MQAHCPPAGWRYVCKDVVHDRLLAPERDQRLRLGDLGDELQVFVRLRSTPSSRNSRSGVASIDGLSSRSPNPGYPSRPGPSNRSFWSGTSLPYMIVDRTYLSGVESGGLACVSGIEKEFLDFVLHTGWALCRAFFGNRPIRAASTVNAPPDC